MSSTRAARRKADASRDVLEHCLAAFDPEAARNADPLGVVLDAPSAWRVLAAHLTAALAYGRAELIRGAARQVLVALQDRDPDPERLLAQWRPGDFLEVQPTFVYRMTRAEDIDAVLTGLAALHRDHGDLESAFASHILSGEADLHGALGRYMLHIRQASGRSERRGVRYLTPDGSTGSATKRGHLMLRWLVRRDYPDLGAWRHLSPAQLVLPLDTHVAWLSGALGLTRRRTPDFRMAREITDHFSRWAPDDPVRYDMALCHVGLSGTCSHRLDLEHCPTCPLAPRCRVGRRHASRLEPEGEAV